MSAPLAVNTKDGVCWTRRTVTSSGIALYAPEGVCGCPEFVMATLPELAEHGIVGSADVLPMPVGPKPPPLSVERLVEAEERGAHLYEYGNDATADEWNRLAGDDVPVLVAEVRRLRSQVAALQAECRTTNEALDDAVREPRADREGPALPWAASMDAGDLGMFLDDLVSAAMNRWRTDADGPVPDSVTLADIERVCANWRTPGQGLRGDAPEEPSADAVTAAFAPVAALREVLDGEHFATVHHDWLIGRDLPELGGGA